MAPAPTAYPPATTATAAARWAESVSSAAPTWATALAAERSGRPRAKMKTNNQYPGLAADAAVTASPRPQQNSSTRRRPTRSASPARGRPPSDASRITASPRPSWVPERPAWSVIDEPWSTWPKCRATSPRVAVRPNWPNPAAMATSPTPMTAGSRHRWRRR